MRIGLNALATLLLVANVGLGEMPLPVGDPLPASAPSMLVLKESYPTFWIRTDYLLWWVKSSPLPTPVATTGPFDPDRFVANAVAGIRQPAPGGLFTPGTGILFGGSDVVYGPSSGVRVSLGGAIDEEGDWGLEGGFFVLARRGADFRAESGPAGVPLLARPFTAVDRQNIPSALTVAIAGDSTGVLGGSVGRLEDRLTTELGGLEVNLAWLVKTDRPLRAAGLFGLRFAKFKEELTMRSVSSPILLPQPNALGGTQAEIGDTLTVVDRFCTRNSFYGAQAGVRVEYLHEKFAFGLTAKVALGLTRQRSSVDGLSTLTSPILGAQTVPGGLYAVASNSGNLYAYRFSVLPELGCEAGVDLAPWARLTLGYTLLCWTGVARPGPQVDPRLDVRQVPTGGRFNPGEAGANPAPSLISSSIYAHGLTVGLGLTY